MQSYMGMKLKARPRHRSARCTSCQAPSFAIHTLARPPQMHGFTARCACQWFLSVLAGPVWRWCRAVGSIADTICSNLEAGWAPSAPCCWNGPSAGAHLEGALFSTAKTFPQFQTDDEQVWEMSAESVQQRHEAKCQLRIHQKSKSRADTRRAILRCKGGRLHCLRIKTSTPVRPRVNTSPNDFALVAATGYWLLEDMSCGNPLDTN